MCCTYKEIYFIHVKTDLCFQFVGRREETIANELQKMAQKVSRPRSENLIFQTLFCDLFEVLTVGLQRPARESGLCLCTQVWSDCSQWSLFREKDSNFGVARISWVTIDCQSKS